MTSNHLKILSIGAGAIGTYIGGSLARTGHEVVFLERPTAAERLKQKGLQLDLKEEKYRLTTPLVSTEIEEALAHGRFDAALFALKSFDTDSALQNLKPFAALLPPLLCLQNGVENEAKITRILGDEKVIAGTVTSAIGRRDVGDVVLERLRGVGVADGHHLSAQLVRAMDQAGLNARLYASAPDMKWSKMLTNLLANASSAILEMTPGEIFANPALFRLEIMQLREALQVMDASNIRVVDLPGTPVRALAFAVRYLPLWLSKLLLQRSVGRGRGTKMPSFYIDLHSGRGQTEVDYLNGAVVRAGERSGIPTPVNNLLTTTLTQLTLEKIPRSTFSHQSELLLSQLNIHS